MTTISALLLLGLLGLPLSAQVIPDEIKTARVTVKAFLMYGFSDLSPLRVRLHRRSDRKDYSQDFQDAKAAGIPFGEYDLEVSVSGFGTERREVSIDQNPTLLVVGFWARSAGHGEKEYTHVNGSVSLGRFETKQRWAKLVSLYSSFVKHAEVNDGGYFLFDNISPGAYLVFVFDDARIVGERDVLVGLKPMSVEFE